MRVFSIPFSGGSLVKGVEFAPSLIKEKLKIKMEEIKIDNFNISYSHKNIRKVIAKQKKRFVAFGGDHSITFPLLQALKRNFKQLGLIVLDAHPDCLQTWNAVTNDNWLSSAIKNRLVNKKNVFIIGVRDIDGIEYEFLKKNRINFFRTLNKEILNFILKRMKNLRFHLSIDLDVLDPKYFPGVSYAARGGLRINEIINFLKAILRFKNLISIDFVEFNPGVEKEKSIKNLKKIMRFLNFKFFKNRGKNSNKRN